MVIVIQLVKSVFPSKYTTQLQQLKLIANPLFVTNVQTTSPYGPKRQYPASKKRIKKTKKLRQAVIAHIA